jgi:hypothetical protein
MPRNPSIGRYSDDVKVCIGFYVSWFLFSAVQYARFFESSGKYDDYANLQVGSTQSWAALLQRDRAGCNEDHCAQRYQVMFDMLNKI